MFQVRRRIPIRLVLAALAAAAVLGGAGYWGRAQAQPVFYTVEPPVVVIDPGHGGIDHGCVGAGGTLEDGVNLAIAKKLAESLQAQGISVHLTREGQEVHYDPNAEGTRKQQDMRNRVQRIEAAHADIVISIHMNSYGKQRGPQVFYQQGHTAGKALAEAVMEQLHTLSSKKRAVSEGDYYILNEPEATSILVECGFLSNPEEEALLIQEDYQGRMAKCISEGIVQYWLAKAKEASKPLP